MNLYLCLTPLQILLANKLISDKREQAEVLVLSYILNEKYDYYSTRIGNNSYVDKLSVIKIDNANLLDKVRTFKNVINWCAGKRFKNIYLASIDNFYMHFILSRCLKGNVYTFDDGTVNIIENSNYFMARPSFMSRAARLLLGINWNIEKIKQHTQKHYTIYNNMKNIVDNVEYLELFSQNYVQNDQVYIEKKIINIYLGQPFLDISASLNVYKKLKALNQYIKYYIHPREDYSFLKTELGEESLLQSHLIVEDYIAEIISQGYSVNLFTVTSSAGFNMYSSENVKVYFVIEESLLTEVGDIYDLILQKSLRTISLSQIQG